MNPRFRNTLILIATLSALVTAIILLRFFLFRNPK